MLWLADEHAFQLLVETLHTAAQTRDQGRQGSERDGNRLSLRTRKQVSWKSRSFPSGKSVLQSRLVLCHINVTGLETS